MRIFMRVSELNADELYQLKEDLYYGRIELMKSFDSPHDIPDTLVYDEYHHIDFVKEDFWCNMN